MQWINPKILRLENAILIAEDKGGVVFLLKEKVFIIKGEITEIASMEQSCEVIRPFMDEEFKRGPVMFNLEELKYGPRLPADLKDLT